MESIIGILVDLREFLDTANFDEIIRNPYVLGAIAIIIIIGLVKKSPGLIVITLSVIGMGFLFDRFLPKESMNLEEQQMDVVLFVGGLVVIAALNIYVFFIRSD